MARNQGQSAVKDAGATGTLPHPIALAWKVSISVKQLKLHCWCFDQTTNHKILFNFVFHTI